MADDHSALITPVFKNIAVQSEARSRAAGRPVFDDIEVVEIRFAGDRQKVAAFPAHEPEPNATREAAARGEPPVTYAEVYGKQYRAFKERNAQTVAGTPLTELTFLTEAQRSELRAMNVHTAETLAALDGTPLKALGMGGREKKNAARAYLDKAAGSADTTRLAQENEDLRQQLDEMREQIALLAEQGKAAPPAAAAADQGDEDESDAEDEGDGAGESRDLADLSDAELKAFIKRETGEPVRDNPSRETLIERATEIATRPDAE